MGPSRGEGDGICVPSVLSVVNLWGRPAGRARRKRRMDPMSSGDGPFVGARCARPSIDRARFPRAMARWWGSGAGARSAPLHESERWTPCPAGSPLEEQSTHAEPRRRGGPSWIIWTRADRIQK